MTTVEFIKKMCKDRNIPIAKLERDCGFSNGYISGLRKGTIRDDRLKIIADYFNVAPSYLLEVGNIVPNNGQDEVYYLNDETRELADLMKSNPEYKTLFEASRKLTPEDLRFVIGMIERFSE